MIRLTARNKVEQLCVKLSSDRLIVQGPGGNVSWKQEDKLWIKLSGTWLQNAEKEDIFGSINLLKLKKLIEDQNYSFDSNIMDQANFRPSIEVMLHAIIDKKYVFHLHMAEVISYIQKKPQFLIDNLKKNNINSCIIPYKKPGEELAKEVQKKINKNIDLFLLMNHGVIISANKINKIEKIISLLKKYTTKKTPIFKKYYIDNDSINLNINKDIYKNLNNPELNSLVCEIDIFSNLDLLWPICPDHIVFLGPKVYKFQSLKEACNYINIEESPLLVFIKDYGIYVNKKQFKEIHLIQLQFFFDIIYRIDDFSSLKVLTQKEIFELINMDSEKYRIKQNQ